MSSDQAKDTQTYKSWPIFISKIWLTEAKVAHRLPPQRRQNNDWWIVDCISKWMPHWILIFYVLAWVFPHTIWNLNCSYRRDVPVIFRHHIHNWHSTDDVQIATNKMCNTQKMQAQEKTIYIVLCGM